MSKKTKDSQQKLGLDGGGWISNSLAKLKDDADRSLFHIDNSIDVVSLAGLILATKDNLFIESKDRKDFDDAQAFARIARDDVVALLDRIGDESLRYELLIALDQLCFHIAQLSRFTAPATVVQQGLTKTSKRDQAKTGTEANAKAAEGRHEELYKAIKDEAKALNIAVAKSIKFARQVRPGVVSRLRDPDNREAPGEKDWPSEGTIRRCVMKASK